MEPFSIACTTCQARLRVRDESVIGQILTCPKCGSMVLVEPVGAVNDLLEHSVSEDSAPAHDTALSANLSAPSADFEAATTLFDEPNEPYVPNSPDLTETVEDLSVQAESRLDTGESNVDLGDAGGWKSESGEADALNDVAALEMSPPPLPPAGEMLLPNADWTSAETAKWRNRILTGIAAVVGVVLAVTLLIVFSGGDQSSTIASRPIASVTASTGTIASDKSKPPESEQLAATAIPDSDPVPPPADNTSSGTSSDATSQEVAADASSEPPVAPPNETPAPPVTPGADPAPLGVEPVANDPPTDEPPGLTPKDATVDAEGAGGESSPLSDTMREFGALLEKAEERVSLTPTVPAELPPEPDSNESEDESVVRRPGPRVVELADRLSDPVKQIEFDGVPLADFLQFASDYSTIPITLDADILRWTRVSPKTAVKLKGSETTVAEILRDGLAPLGLEYRIESEQLFVTRRSKDETGRRTVTFKVEDLVGSDATQLQQLGTQIMDFAEPESWSSRGGVGTIAFRGSELIIEQYERVQFGILDFCEKLRVARGLKTRSPYDASMFRLETRGERARPKLAKSITLTYIRPAPLQRIVHRIAQSADLQILIDWRALAEAGWGPDTEVRFSVADQPVAKALAVLLEPMDLAYRIVDESTFQVTTPEVVDARLELEFYRVPKRDDHGAKLVQSVRDALGPANFRDSGGGSQIAFDEPSNCLLAYLPQPQQLELQAWLSAQPGSTASSVSVEATTPMATFESRTVPTSGRASND